MFYSFTNLSSQIYLILTQFEIKFTLSLRVFFFHWPYNFFLKTDPTHKKIPRNIKHVHSSFNLIFFLFFVLLTCL